MDPAHAISQHERGVAAALRESALAAKYQTDIRDGDDRQPNGRVRAHIDANRRRVDRSVGIESDQDPVRAQTRFIHQIGAEYVGFIHGEYLAMSLPRVAKAGNRSAGGGFPAQIALVHPISMDAVDLTELVVDVCGSLVDIDRRGRRSEERRSSVAEYTVGLGNKVEQSLGNVVGAGLNSGSLSRAESAAGYRKTLALPQAFITQEEERGALVQRAAKVPTKLISLERINGRNTLAGEGIAGVKPVIAQIVVNFAMERIRAGTRGDIHNRAGVTAVLRAICGVIHLKLGNGVDRRLEGDLVLHHVVQVDAVDHEVHGIFTVARGIKRKRSLSAQRRRQEAVLRRRDCSWNQQRQIDKVAAVQRNVLDRTLVDGLAHGNRGAFNHRSRRFNGDNFLGGGHCQAEVLDRVFTYFEHQVLGQLCLESGHLYLNTVDSGRERRHFIGAG